MLMLVLCIGVLGVGIFAMNPITNNITGNIVVTAANAEVRITPYVNSESANNMLTAQPITTRNGAPIVWDDSKLTFNFNNLESDAIESTKTIL